MFRNVLGVYLHPVDFVVASFDKYKNELPVQMKGSFGIDFDPESSDGTFMLVDFRLNVTSRARLNIDSKGGCHTIQHHTIPCDRGEGFGSIGTACLPAASMSRLVFIFTCLCF